MSSPSGARRLRARKPQDRYLLLEQIQQPVDWPSASSGPDATDLALEVCADCTPSTPASFGVQAMPDERVILVDSHDSSLHREHPGAVGIHYRNSVGAGCGEGEAWSPSDPGSCPRWRPPLEHCQCSLYPTPINNGPRSLGGLLKQGCDFRGSPGSNRNVARGAVPVDHVELVRIARSQFVHKVGHPPLAPRREVGEPYSEAEVEPHEQPILPCRNGRVDHSFY